MCHHHSLLISNPANPTSDLLIPNEGSQLEIDSVEYHCGWGKCNRDWCNCKAFEGNDDLCRNCGHSYSEHYEF